MNVYSAAPPLRLALIGAGRAGRQFALRCLLHGQSVVLEDVLPAKLRVAEEELSPQIPGLASRITLVLTVEDAVRDADLAIDFVPDELESKLEIFSLVDRMAPPRTILLTPTETLSIADLASCTYRPERCFALRGLDHSISVSSFPAVKEATGAPRLTLTYPALKDEAALASVQALLLQLNLPHAHVQDEMPSMLTGR